jgi:RimJ/RimL family protein N-acetyltransferase
MIGAQLDPVSDAAGWARPPGRLDGRKVVVELLEPRHLPQLYEASRDARVWRWYFGEVPDRSRFEQWFEAPFAFDGLGCRRVEFKADARNERSRAAMAALPARFEGIFRHHMVVPYDDGIRDSAYYSIIAPEWPGVRANLERRLSAR